MFQNFSEGQREKIRNYVHNDYPLGPINALEIDNKYVCDVLFEKQSKVYNKITDRPSIIVGRRGSGKTAFLKNLVYSDKYRITIDIKTYKSFAQMVKSVQKAIETDGFVFSEDVAELWLILFWSSILVHMKKSFPEDFSKNDKLSNLLDNLDINSDMTEQAIVRAVVNLLNKHSDGSAIGVAEDALLELSGGNFESFDEIKEEAQSILDDNKAKVIILMDSLDDYQLSIDYVRRSLSGLLMCVGSFNSVRKRPEIRFCLPAELFHVFAGISENRVKDFSQKMVMHWHAGELLSVAAHRYNIYLSIYDEGDQDILNVLRKLDVHDRKEAIEFFEAIFPDEIENKVGLKEKPISYILRHTQLVPRQLLRYLTAIFKINQRTYSGTATKVHPKAIIDGVATVEGELWKEVCAAYSFIYPDAKDVCKAVVPELPLEFTDGELRKIYTKHGKAACRNKDLDYFEFKRMMIEIGCIGVVKDRKDTYIEGVFEYTMPESLYPSINNNLCLHPMFCGGSKTETMASKHIQCVVYPYGADPEGRDYRDI